MDLKDHIRAVPDFPKPGILFYDISTLLANSVAWREAVDQLATIVKAYKPDILAGIQSRGFLLAAPLALELDLGFIMVRKQGKLPGDVVTHDYELEYGRDTVEIQADAVKPGQRVVVLDDLLATGGTLNAAITLLRRVRADVVAAACIIELGFLNGRRHIDVPMHSLVTYDS
jgi:adenine phosphoribosyltransferase